MPMSTPEKIVRLFPLGGLVFFPNGRLPLRIFEPRYKQMTEDALASDREIVMILPKPGPSTDRSLSILSEPLGKFTTNDGFPTVNS